MHCELSLLHSVCDPILRLDVLDGCGLVLIDAFNKVLQVNTTSACNMSHCWTSSFDHHFDDCFYGCGRSPYHLNPQAEI